MLFVARAGNYDFSLRQTTSESGVVEERGQMCCVLEIGMLIFGIIALVTGKMKLSRDKVVQGPMARFLGAVGIVPLPLAMVVGFLIGFANAPAPGQPMKPEVTMIAAGVEAAIVLVAAAIVFGVGFAIGQPEQQYVQPYGHVYGQPGQVWQGNAPPQGNYPHQPPYQPPPQQGGPFDPFRQ